MSLNDSGGRVDVAEAEEAIAKMRIELQQELMQGMSLFKPLVSIARLGQCRILTFGLALLCTDARTISPICRRHCTDCH
jgi:hypothetical protein